MIPRAAALFLSTGSVALAVATAAGCGSSSDPIALTPEHSTVETPYTPKPASAGDAEAAPDSSAAAASHQGNPLCNASHFAGPCYPDDPATAKSCGFGADASTYGVPTLLACHVTPVTDVAQGLEPGAVVEPTCSLPGPGGAGASCAQPGDCGAGSECVGAGTCRRYCCGGDTECLASEFCDTQPLVQSPKTKVPVCMPIHPCGLFNEPADVGACPPSQTCSLVRSENGTTGCLPVGPARAGESCETDYCARGLACLGTWSKLTCYTLCHTAAPVECSSGQACKGGFPMFPDPAFGVCQ